MPSTPRQNEATNGNQGSGIDELARIFSQIIDVPKDRQETMLEEICPDTVLRQQVRVLLDADSSADPLLDHALVPKPFDVCVGEHIDGYELIQELARGGMGVVFMAEQLEPVCRKVALKVIKPGVDTREVIARFDAERQALSLMDHPNIATVLDAGTTDKGRPYFVMELVKGQSITTYCDEHQLSVKKRLELFLPVCHAIQHAHQKGIVHRDIKPSNILVTEYDGRPIAKVIDFGIAKAVNQGLSDMTVHTGFGQIIGTFEYMSPEQSRVKQLDVDTRSDIYSLGALLYELLTEGPPFDKDRLRSAPWEEMLRIIREEDPPKPSARLAENNQARSGGKRNQNDSTNLARTVRGELDWIVLKAMEKDRDRRYETPNELANDIDCFLRGDAVAACPPSRMYVFSKFVKRNKVALATSAIVAASLVLGLIGTTWQSIQAQRAKDAMKASAEETEAINEYFIKDLLDLERFESQISAGQQPDPNLRLDTVLDRALDRVDDRFGDQRDLKANLKATLARSFNSIGRYEAASKLYEERLKYLKKENGGERDLDSVQVMRKLVRIYINQSRLAEAERLCSKALDICKDLGDEHEVTFLLRIDSAVLSQKRGRNEEAKRKYRECLELKPDHPETLGIMNNLALLYESLNRFDAAEDLHRNVMSVHSQKNPPEQLSIAASLNNLGRCCLKRGRHFEDQKQFVAAVPLLEKGLEICKHEIGRDYLDHPNTLEINRYLAQVYCELRRYDAAESILNDLVERLKTLRSAEDHTRLDAMNTLGWTYMHLERFAEAEYILTEAIEDRQPLNPKDPWTLQVKGNLAIVYRLMGKLEDSISLDEETLALSKQELGPAHTETVSRITRLGLNYLDTEDTRKGQTFLEDAFNSSQKLPGAFRIAGKLANSYNREGDTEKARLWTQRQTERARNNLK